MITCIDLVNVGLRLPENLVSRDIGLIIYGVGGDSLCAFDML